jgi:subtilisin family serine protease
VVKKYILFLLVIFSQLDVIAQTGLIKDIATTSKLHPHRVIISLPGVNLSKRQQVLWRQQIEKSLNQLTKTLKLKYKITTEQSSTALTKEGRNIQRRNEHRIIGSSLNDFKAYKAESVFPSLVIQVPERVPLEEYIIKLKNEFAKNKELNSFGNWHVSKDHAVTISHSFSGLGMFAIRLDDLEKLRAGTLIPGLEKKLAQLQKVENPTDDQKSKQEYLKKRLESLKKAEQILFWYQSIPTIGLRDIEDPSYPFIPHYFSLWELAPNKGKGIKVALVDTGVAAFQVASEKQYRKNIDLKMVANFTQDTFNVVGNDNIDPLEQLVYKFEEYIDPKKFNFEQLMQNFPVWIKVYLTKKDDHYFKDYLIKNGRPIYREKDGLSDKGEALLKKILIRIADDFSLIWLEEPVREQVVKELIPLAEISDKESTFISGHGSHTFGLVGGLLQGNQFAMTPKHDEGICGLAPSADLLMIKAFDQEGNSARSTLAEAVKRAKAYNVDILNLSLKVSDRLDTADEDIGLLDRLLGLIPYVVSASGNDGNPKGKNYPGPVESYPAKLSSVEFDVGSFGIAGQDPYNISDFSQYETLVGPKIVAPGYNILSSGLVPGQMNNSVYVFMDGTSMATPIVSGFVALMLGEFKEDFTRRQLLDTCYTSVVRLYDNAIWRNKTLLGTIDMRAALFTLHVLKYCKEQLAKNKIDYDFNTHFENLLAATNYILYYDVERYSEKYLKKISIKNNFMHFINQSNERKNSYNKNEYFVPSGWSKLSNSIEYVAYGILHAIDSTWTSSLPEGIHLEIDKILKQNNFNIFNHLPKRVQDRLRQAEDQNRPIKVKKRKYIV